MAIPLPIGKRENRNSSRKTPSGKPDIGPKAAAAMALRGLAPDHRAALVETYFRGRSVREAAKVLGVSPELLKTRVYYAMRALNLALSELGATPAA
jgi:RNA polymerase sigma-70 factor (ECF subfamily)